MIPHQWPRVIQSKKDYVQHQRDVYGPIQLNSVDDYISEQHHGDIAPKSYGKEELLTYIARQSKKNLGIGIIPVEPAYWLRTVRQVLS